LEKKIFAILREICDSKKRVGRFLRWGL